MPDDARRAADLLGIHPGAGRAAVRHAFRAVLRRERPDLGRMTGERLARLVAARDLLLASAPADEAPAPAVRAARPGRGHGFEAPARPAASRLVDVYA